MIHASVPSSIRIGLLIIHLVLLASLSVHVVQVLITSDKWF